jgi:hypothetical protein
VSGKREVLEVGVSRRILWIGAAAYPLHNIARAQTVEIRPDRAGSVRKYLGQVLAWLVLGFAVAVLPGHQGVLAVFIVLGLLAISTIRLGFALTAGSYYAMLIETSGSPQTALVTADRREVATIVQQTMEAIDNPSAEFHTQVNHVTNIGEQYNLSGHGNIGKRVSR